MVKNYQPVKVTSDFHAFLNKLIANRTIVMSGEGQRLTLTEALTLIERYFKNNNSAYKEMLSEDMTHVRR